MEPFKIGDLVVRQGFQWNNEPDRHGEVVDLYRGVSSAVGPGEAMMAIKWMDTGLIERGYLNRVGMIIKEFRLPPIMLMPPRIVQ
jgi:hypothetical protein